MSKSKVNPIDLSNKEEPNKQDLENLNHVDSHTGLLEDKFNSDLKNFKKKPKKGKKDKKDPLLVQSVSLHEDAYALTWNALRKSPWENVEVHNEKIFLTKWDDFKLIVSFLFFITVVILTVGILLYESFVTDAYNDAEWPIVILRLTLVAFAQKKLEPEIYQGLALFRYTRKNTDDFFHPNVAKFVALCQFLIASLTFIAIFLFVCMANEALELIMNFAGLAVISELDDWVGEQIMSESIHKDIEEGPFKDATFDTKDLNNRMDMFTKISLIGEDMEIEDDQNESSNFISTISSYIPWTLIPLLTLPCEYILLHIQKATGAVTGN